MGNTTERKLTSANVFLESGVEWSGVEWSGVEWSGVEKASKVCFSILTYS
jgi:hypothetical protein